MTKSEIENLFRQKYDLLDNAYHRDVGPFDTTKMYRNPDGGWQLNLQNWAAITIRPGDAEAHETHGAICAKWYVLGAAFDENGVPGLLGYPVTDEIPGEVEIDCTVIEYAPGAGFSFPRGSLIRTISAAHSTFERGKIEWHGGRDKEVIGESWSDPRLGSVTPCVAQIDPETKVTPILPDDIRQAVEYESGLLRLGTREVETFSWDYRKPETIWSVSLGEVLFTLNREGEHIVGKVMKVETGELVRRFRLFNRWKEE